MERMNEARFIGNVGQFKKGDDSLYLAIAINESYKPKDATEWVENTVWVDVVVFGPAIAKVTTAGIEKGDAVLVIGKLSQRTFEGKRYTQVIAQKVQLIQKSKKNSGLPSEAIDSNNNSTGNGNQDYAGAESLSGAPDDDLPF